MLTFAIIAGLVLLVVLLLLLFRINSLADVMKTEAQRRASTSNRVNAILMMVFLIGACALFFWYSIARQNEYKLPVASDHGIVTDNLFWISTVVTGIVFIITHILLFWFSYKYQYKKNAKAHYYPENNKLEIYWTVIPAIVLTGLVFSGWKAWSDITDKAPEGAEVVEIVGQQFQWSARYPGKDKQLGAFDFRKIDDENSLGIDFSDKSSFDDFIPRKIYLPVNRPVEFKIRAKDVLHSVYVPHFRLKMDAVPGMPTRFWFVPNKTTAQMREDLNNSGNPVWQEIDPNTGEPKWKNFNYELACTEICGRGHFSMKMLIEVVEEAEYKEWYAQQKSWLSTHEDYLSKVPADLKELAVISAGIESDKNN
ncbi:cytochrome c oxidase subunit II [Fulvivirgaceae bacterium BMA12]|uniref:Cytochrome c oxidase subunit 2 n=1 Tax=Agaribacillus aureus TaxID=3051825 RepID=A0ABT8L1I1_9BACT|nr:cytochrome c oxidase subunit II [Fulvivirgaceae bacterium BMA12]